jgi:hypothetical protein
MVEQELKDDVAKKRSLFVCVWWKQTEAFRTFCPFLFTVSPEFGGRPREHAGC